jgi:hypothetical protein
MRTRQDVEGSLRAETDSPGVTDNTVRRSPSGTAVQFRVPGQELVAKSLYRTSADPERLNSMYLRNGLNLLWIQTDALPIWVIEKLPAYPI